MATNPNNPPRDPPCETILYRLILKRAWLDPDDPSRVKAEAFMRRKPILGENGEVVDPRDSDGLSVFDSYRISQQDCLETCLSCFGIATLHVGTLLDRGLTIIREQGGFAKVLITNAPFENPNDPAQEDLAEAIAETARIALRCKHRKTN